MEDFRLFPKIDAHSHIGSWGPPFNYDIGEKELIALMDAWNIEKTVLIAAGSQENDKTLQAARAYPDRIIPVVWVDCSQGQPAYDMVEHYLRDEHFAGVKIQSLLDGYAADAPCVDPVLELCKQYKVPFFAHSGHEPFSLPWQIGLLAERHPEVPVVMLHMGHGHGIYVEATLTMAKRYPNIYLETSGTSMSRQIYNAYRDVGSDRVLFGLDAPFHEPSVEIQKVGACGIDEAGLRKMFYDNAAALLGLK